MTINLTLNETFPRIGQYSIKFTKIDGLTFQEKQSSLQNNELKMGFCQPLIDEVKGFLGSQFFYILVVLPAVVVLLIVSLVIFFVVRHKRKKKRNLGKMN